MSWRVVVRPEIEPEVAEAGRMVIVAAVIHGARHDRHWLSRV